MKAHNVSMIIFVHDSLEVKTMMKIRGWERYQFLIDYRHRQASSKPRCSFRYSWLKTILNAVQSRPGATIAQQPQASYCKENRGSSVCKGRVILSFQIVLRGKYAILWSNMSLQFVLLQVPFLTGLHGFGEIRTMFAAEVCRY